MKRTRMTGLASLTALLLLTCACGNPKVKPKEEFQSLRLQVIAGEYDKAIPQLESFIKENPNSKNASRAGLFLFKAYFAKNQLSDAGKWCQWTIKNHPNSLEAHKCRYKLALISLVSGNSAKTKSELKLVADDTDNPLSPEASRLLKFLDEFSIQKK